MQALESPFERVSEANLVIPICADEDDLANLRLGNEVFQQLEGGGIQPLQIVEEKRQRVLRAGEYPKKAAEKRLEARLSFLRRKVGDRLLGSNDSFDFWNQVYDELAIRPQCFAQSVAPMSDLAFVPTQNLADQSLECLCQRCVGNIAFVLVELA